MKRSRCLVLSILASALAAQDPAVPKPPAPIEASLTPVSRVVVAGTEAELVLRIKVLANAELDPAVLNGLHVTRKIGDGETITIGGPGTGTIRAGPGAVIERTCKVDLKVPADPGGGLAHVTVAWPGLPGATAALEVAPEQSSIQVDALDLTQTKALLVTSYGTIKLGFLADKAPKHVANFLELAKKGFYDGTKFHRVIRGFMIQGGCPNTKEGAQGEPGTGSPGYNVPAEFSDVRHVRGIVSMARGGDPNSAGCQFFLCHGEANWLDGKYSAFAKVEEGIEALDKIADVPVTANRSGETSVPTLPIHLYAVIVLPALKKQQ